MPRTWEMTEQDDDALTCIIAHMQNERDHGRTNGRVNKMLVLLEAAWDRLHGYEVTDYAAMGRK